MNLSQSKYSKEYIQSSGLSTFLKKSVRRPSVSSSKRPSVTSDPLFFDNEDNQIPANVNESVSDGRVSLSDQEEEKEEDEEEEDAPTRNYFQSDNNQNQEQENSATRTYNQPQEEIQSKISQNPTYKNSYSDLNSNETFQEYDNDDLLMQNSKIIDIFTNQKITNLMLESSLDDAALLANIIKICQQNGLSEIKELESGQDLKIYKTKISKVLKCQRADKRMSAIKIIKVDNQGEDLNKETTIWNETQKVHALFGQVATATLYSQQNIKSEADNNKINLVIIYMEFLEKSLNALMQEHEYAMLNMQRIWMNEKREGKSMRSRHKYVPLQASSIIKIMNDLITSLFLMHLNGMHHMDIKSLNIMYHDIIDRFVFIDFGASDMLNDNDVSSCTQDCFRRTCTIEYCPEEMTIPDRSKVSQGENRINPYAVDVWSLGMIMMNLVLLTLQANEVKELSNSTKWQDLRSEFEDLRRKMGRQYTEWRQGGISRNHIDAYYAFVEGLTNQIFFNLNNHDVEVDFNNTTLKKGVNHLKAMLMRDPTKRITIYELAMDINLNILQYMIHSHPHAKVLSTSSIIYANGTTYEGEIEKSKRQGYGILSYNSHEIYRGEWIDDIPLFETQIEIHLPQRLQKVNQPQKQQLIARFTKHAGQITCVALCQNGREMTKSSIQAKYLRESILINGQFFLKGQKEGTSKIYLLQSDSLLAMQGHVKQHSDMAFSSLVEYQCKIAEVIYAQKVVQNLLFGITFKAANLKLQIAREIQFLEHEEPYFFYNFLCDISHQYKLDVQVNQQYDQQISHICNYLLFIIANCHFMQIKTPKQIEYTLTSINLPRKNMNDSHFINLVTCFHQALPRLINMAHNQQISDISLRYLFTCADLTQLTTLILTGTSISDFLLDDLMLLKSLEHLDLSHCDRLTSYCNQFIIIHIIEINIFFKGGHFSSLRHVNLCYTASRGEVLESLAQNSSLKNLISLELKGCALDENTIVNSLSSLYLPVSLNYLNLQATGISETTLVAISSSRQVYLHNLEKLDIACNQKIKSLLALFKNDQHQIPYLLFDLSWTSVPCEQLSIISRSSLVNRQTKLIFNGLEHISDAVMEDIISRTNVKEFQLMCVDVDESALSTLVHPTEIHIEHVRSLSQAYYIQLFTVVLQFTENLSNLTLIDLTGTHFTDMAMKEMAANESLTMVTRLVLDKCTQLSDIAMPLICRSSFAGVLCVLHMAFTNITDTSLEWLAQSQHMKQLCDVSFRVCKKITNSGTEMLLRSRWLMSQLQSLDLSHNQLGFKTLRKALKVMPNFRSPRQLINLHGCVALYKPIPAPVSHHKGEFKALSRQYLLSLSESPSFSILLPKLLLSFVPELTDPIFTQMLQSKYITTITEIDVSFTNIRAMSVRMLADNGIVQANIEELHLAGCEIADLALSRLMRKGFPKLKVLDLSQTKISDVGLTNLQTMGTRLRSLLRLQIDFCDNITLAGVTQFKAGHNFPSLEEIHPHPYGNLV